MEQLGHNLFAGTVLAGDEDIGVGGTDLGDEFENRLHIGRARNELRHPFRAEQAVFEFELTRSAQGLVQLSMNADDRDEALVLPRLLDEVASAALDALDGEIDVAPRGHDDYRQARIDLLKASEQIETLFAGGSVARVVEIDEQNVVVALPERLEQKLR